MGSFAWNLPVFGIIIVENVENVSKLIYFSKNTQTILFPIKKKYMDLFISIPFARKRGGECGSRSTCKSFPKRFEIPDVKIDRGDIMGSVGGRLYNVGTTTSTRHQELLLLGLF